MYKVLYNSKTGRNTFISFSNSNRSSWGVKLPYKSGCSTKWEVHLGKLHIESVLPNSPNEG